MRHRVEAAAARLGGHIITTPLEHSPWLSATTGAEVYLKLENTQRTGSFKYRGATNKLLCLDDQQRHRGVVAASTGNHGAALACSAAKLGIPVLVFAPEDAATTKIEAIARFNAEIRYQPGDALQSELAARRFAETKKMVYVSPYNDLDVIAGQGTVAVEMLSALAELDTVIVAVGGGGLIAGVGSYLKALRPEIQIVACSPKNSPAMYESLQQGRIVTVESSPTLSDGTAGGIEENAVTLSLCQQVIDDFLLVDEAAIGGAVRDVIFHHHTLIEGAAGVAVAACQQIADRIQKRTAGVILCGANIDPGVLKTLL